MVWNGHVRSDKFERDFLTRTFALIVIDWPICIECSNKMVPNAPKHYEMQQNLSFVYHGVSSAYVANRSNASSRHDLLHELHQIGPFASSLVHKQNRPKCTKTLRNATKHEVLH